MELIIKMAGIAAVGAALSLLLKKDNPSFAFMVCLAASGFVMFSAVQLLDSVVDAARNMADRTGVTGVEFAVVLKSLGIAIVTKLASQVSTDAGQSSVATAIQQCGAASIIWCAMPLIFSILDTIGGLLCS